MDQRDVHDDGLTPGVDSTRGILFPARLPTMHRLPPADDIAWMVRWFWIPQWHLAPGRISRQTLLPYPASNLVVEAGDAESYGAGVGIAGPTTRQSHRDLTGSGWAVGALLRPAAAPLIPHDLGAIRDAYLPFEAPELALGVSAAMAGSDEESRTERAAAVFTDWLAQRDITLTEDGRRANAMADMIETDSEIIGVNDIAERMNLSPRTIQRLTRRYVGLTPNIMIRRRRLQEAAETLRTDPSVTIADVAAALGYTDHAHLATEFRDIVGFTPSGYRTETGH